MSSSLRIIASCLLLLACGDESGTRDAGDDPTRDAGRRDAGACRSGQHRCGGGCVDDLPNDPANGCRLGCGEPCPTPPSGVAACDETTFACTFACEPPFHREGDECVCMPRTCAELSFECGAPDDGCGTTLDCGACPPGGVCTEGRCLCPPDDREPNDSTLAVKGTELAHIPDVNTWEMTFDGWNLHSPTDQDWYRFRVTDTGTDNPRITITLSRIPAGSDFSLSAYYVCDGGTDASTCTIGRPCSGMASGTTQEQVIVDVECDRGTFGGSEDSGALYVHVSSVRWMDACAPYSLHVHSAS